MSFVNNIQSVAKYESKILIRSWFFKVFTVLALLILGFFDFGMLVADNGGGMWMLKALPFQSPLPEPAFTEYRAGSHIDIPCFGVFEKG